MEDRVKGARAPKKATASQETGQKQGELLQAVLEELKTHREELKAHNQVRRGPPPSGGGGMRTLLSVR